MTNSSVFTSLLLILLFLGETLTAPSRVARPRPSASSTIPTTSTDEPAAPQLSSLNSLSQLLLYHISKTLAPPGGSPSCRLSSLAGCTSSELKAFGFSEEVVATVELTTAPEIPSEVFRDTLSAVHLHQVLTLATKLNALITVNSALANILYVNSLACSQALDTFFATSPNLKILDIRGIPHLSVILVSSNIPNIPVLINFASLVSISTLFNEPFLQVSSSLFSDEHSLILQSLKSVEFLLVRVAVLLQSVLFSVVGLSDEVVRHITGELTYPTLSQVTVVFPSLQNMMIKSRKSQKLFPSAVLSAQPQELTDVPTARLSKALPLYQLLNSVK